MFLCASLVCTPITGAVVPCSSPTTRTSWLPACVSVKATTVAGSGLSVVETAAVEMPRRRPSGALPGVKPAVALAGTAWTTTGFDQASVVAPESIGGAADAEVALTIPPPETSHR